MSDEGEFDININEKKLSALRGIFRRRKDLLEQLLKGEITTEEVKAILAFRSYLEIALYVSAALLLSVFIPISMSIYGIIEPLFLLRLFIITFLITLSAAYMADRNRRPLFAKASYIGASASNKVYTFLVTLGEVLADGKLTPEEGAKLIQAIFGKGGGKK